MPVTLLITKKQCITPIEQAELIKFAYYIFCNQVCHCVLCLRETEKLSSAFKALYTWQLLTFTNYNMH